MESDARLHVDLAERMREHVVQLARDAHALGLHRALPALAREPAELAQALAPRPEALADAEHDQDAQRRPRDAERRPLLAAENAGDGDRRDPAGADRDPGPDALPAHYRAQ